MDTALRPLTDAGNDDDLLEWYPSQVKGPVDDEVQEGRRMAPARRCHARLRLRSSGLDLDD